MIVRTALYPHRGQLDNDRLFKQLVDQADQYNAYCYFAGVGIANADGKTAQEMATPVRGAAYHVSFAGLKIMTLSDRVTVLGTGAAAQDAPPLVVSKADPGEVSAEVLFNEEEALRILARMWNTMDVALLLPHMAQTFTYGNQSDGPPITNRTDLEAYIRIVLRKYKYLGGHPYTELGSCRLQGVTRPCVILAEPTPENLVGLAFITVEGGKISRIDLYSSDPHPADAVRSGVYPGLEG